MMATLAVAGVAMAETASVVSDVVVADSSTNRELLSGTNKSPLGSPAIALHMHVVEHAHTKHDNDAVVYVLIRLYSACLTAHHLHTRMQFCRSHTYPIVF